MLDRLFKQRVLPVVVIDNADDAEPLAAALTAGGMEVIEITCRTPAAMEAIRRIKQSFPDVRVGAGTVVTPSQAHQCLEIGVDFGVAPGLNPDTVSLFQARGIPFIPGIMTPSEIERGLSLGCNLLKFFPAKAAGGTAMLKSLAAPYAPLGVRFCPTGGIGPETMGDWLRIPCVSVIGGSWIATREQIGAGDWETITRQAADALASVPAG
jgi:2-dehydro-3-deoxyphosphogluconate aldolase/(4S)-4-hydroxy-2-oxoglutarate aldolase